MMLSTRLTLQVWSVMFLHADSMNNNPNSHLKKKLALCCSLVTVNHLDRM